MDGGTNDFCLYQLSSKIWVGLFVTFEPDSKPILAQISILYLLVTTGSLSTTAALSRLMCPLRPNAQFYLHLCHPLNPTGHLRSCVGRRGPHAYPTAFLMIIWQP